MSTPGHFFTVYHSSSRQVTSTAIFKNDRIWRPHFVVIPTAVVRRAWQEITKTVARNGDDEDRIDMLRTRDRGVAIHLPHNFNNAIAVAHVWRSGISSDIFFFVPDECIKIIDLAPDKAASSTTPLEIHSRK